MKREDVKNKIPGITEEQLNWIMAENGNDVNREKTAAEQYKTRLENTQAQLKTAQDGLAAFDGKKKPEEYEAELAKLKGDMQAQAEGFAFDNALNTAILGAKGRSVKAVRALLDLDALKGSKDRSTDISKALEEAAKANPWAFGDSDYANVAVVQGAGEGENRATVTVGLTDATGADRRELYVDARDIQPDEEKGETNKSEAYLERLMARGTNKLLEQLRTGSIELTIDAEGLSPGDVAFCTIPELGYKATVRVADVITQSQSDSTTRTVRLGTPVWRKL